MSLIYFDGMDQYAEVAAPAAGSVSLGLGATPSILGTVATDPTIMTLPTPLLMFIRCAQDPERVYTQIGRAFVGSRPGLTTYTDGTYSPTRGDINGPNYIQFDTLRSVEAGTSLTFGYKMKLATNRPSEGHVLAAFSKDAADWRTGNKDKMALIYFPSSGALHLRPITYSIGYGLAVTNYPAGTFKEDPTLANGFLGTSNMVYSAVSGNVPTPSIGELASNTVEMSLYADGRVSVWINNIFVGAVTFNDPAFVKDARYIRIGPGPQRTVSFPDAQVLTYLTQAFSDIYLLNGLGTRNTSRLGKVKVVSRVPKTDVTVAFTRPDTANSNASVVGQIPAKLSPALTGTKSGDTDIYASDAFAFTNEAIIATSVTTGGYKTDPTGNDIAPVLRIGTTNYVGNTNIVPIGSTTMKLEQHIYEVNPATGLPFTKSDLDASRFGVTVVDPMG